RAAGAILTEGSSCGCALLPAGGLWGWWCRLALHAEKPLKKVAPRLRRRNRNSASRGSRSTPRDSSLSISFGFNVGGAACARHLSICALPRVGILLIIAASVDSRITKTHFFDHLERISLPRGRKPCDLRFELPLGHR